MRQAEQSIQARALGHRRMGKLLCTLLLTPAVLNVGCSKGGEGSSGGIGGKTGGATGGADSTGTGGIDVAAIGSGNWGSGGTAGSIAGRGGATGTGSDTSVTDLSSSQTLGSLSPMDATKLCNDTNTYFGKTLSRADLCKWAGLTHGVSSIASSDAILQKSCKSQETSCLQASSAGAKCDPIPASCSVTVSQHSACIAAEAEAFNKAVSGLPGCATVALPDLAGIWEYGTADLPDSCAPIAEQCPTYNIPVPRPPSSVTSTDGSGGQPGSGSSTKPNGAGGLGADAGAGGTGGSTRQVGSGGATGGSATSGAGAMTAAIQGLPGDVAKAAGTPFVAAHAMTRALFASYAGPLFKALRDSDKQEKDIGIVASTRLVDMTALDSFCSGTTCKVTTLYDQSGNGNDLWRGDVATNAPMDNGEAPKLCDLIAIEYMQLSDGSRLPVAVETGAMWKAKAQCLRNRDKTKNMPLNASPQTTYAIFHSKYLNNNCCFNYGNTGKRIHYTGPGTLSALNFSKIEFWSKGTGKGPWVMVDWEQGVYAGNIAKCGSGAAQSADCTATGENPNPPITFDVVTALAKHDGTKHWQIKAGNAKSGSLTVSIDLPTLPKGYSPLKQEGGLGLGEGGAGDPNGTGGFSEGAVVAAETTDAVDNAIQQSIVNVYGK
ncbi:MAG TPA: arabinofuranosidase catalytic domain-containing protein [Polyangiaceae bacterium]|nr:arabinofuranosidase catalytic domain-containing protein [Polyangiaceae bacterium]